MPFLISSLEIRVLGALPTPQWGPRTGEWAGLPRPDFKRAYQERHEKGGKMSEKEKVRREDSALVGG